MSDTPHDKLQPDSPVISARLAAVNQGRWAGWYHWEPVDDFEEHTGPFYCQPEGDGLVCGFLPERKNCNGGGNVHGGR